MTVKLADLGLSESVSPSRGEASYAGQARWTAPEMFDSGEHPGSSKPD